MHVPASARPQMRTCPRCATQAAASIAECPKCQVIFDKVAWLDLTRRRARPRETGHDEHNLRRLTDAPELVVHQVKEKWEILTGLECKNQYSVLDRFGSQLYLAAEQGDGLAALLTRWFLKAARPFTMHILTPEGAPVFVLKKAFRFFFHKLEIFDANEKLLGSIEMRFSFVRRHYTVTDHTTGEVDHIVGPLFKPWTFHISRLGEEAGVITKKWSGLLAEAFSDADNFGITFPPGIDAHQKALFLGAVFLIDAAHFENND